MSLAEKEELCCGCSACKNVCPFGGGNTPAITMQSDEKGFSYPRIDASVCISCHLCEQVCFYQTGKVKLTNRLVRPLSYAVKARDESLRQVSQSGGAFGIFAESVLKRNGVVYGAAFAEDFTVRHIRITNREELDRLHGSKYVQSDMRESYTQIKQDLHTGKLVLFSGTPCQVMGLRKYLRKDYANLLTIDIICYGVPSPRIWQDFLTDCGQKSYGALKCIEMRAKDLGWHICRTRLTYQKKTVLTDAWTRIWGSAQVLRPSCYSCHFTNLERPGDLTVGDCWGAEEQMPDFDDDKGISLLLINTERGRSAWQDCQKEFIARTIAIEAYRQPRLKEPTMKPDGTERFWQDYGRMPRRKFFQIYGELSIGQRIRHKLAHISILRRLYHQIQR